MADPTRAEMVQHLRRAHELGNTELASAIAQKIQELDAPAPDKGFLGELGSAAKDVLHGAQAGFDLGMGPRIQAGLQAAVPMGTDPTTPGIRGTAANYLGMLGGPFGGRAAQYLDPEGYGKRYKRELAAAEAQRKKEEDSQSGVPYQAAKFAAGIPAAIASGGLGGMAALTGLSSAAQAPEGKELSTGMGSAAGTFLLGKAADAAAPYLVEKGTNMGRRAINAISSRLSAKPGTSDAAVQAAAKVGAFVPFGTTKGIESRLENATNLVGKSYGEILEKLEAAGVKGPEAIALAKEISTKGLDAFRNTALDPVLNVYQRAADAIPKTLQSGQKTLELTQAENIKRAQQSMANYKDFKYTPMELAQKDVAATVREANEQAIAASTAPGSPLNPSPEVQALAAKFKPVKEELGKLIEARDAANIGAARSMGRSSASLPVKISAAHALVSGNPYALAVPVAAGLLSRTGNQTGAALAFGAAKRIPQIGLAAQVEWQQQLAKYLREKEQENAP